MAAAQAPIVSYRLVDCPIRIQEVADARPTEIHCGRASLPENRQAPADSRRVSLFFIRIPPETDRGNAPLLHLAGGPGDAASASLGFWLDSIFHKDYEIILVDQRGSGLSLPSLDCPEYGVAARKDWLRDCRQRMIAAGVDLLQYQADAVVWDIYDLLGALKLEHAHLYGNSYGSRLALLLASIAPARLRSMTLDGVYPPARHDLEELAASSYFALERLFDDCEAEAACRARHPDLRETFYQVVAAMNAAPPELTNMGKAAGIRLDGDQFLAWIIGILRYKSAIPILPALIGDFSEGAYDLLLMIDAFVKTDDRRADETRSEGFELSLRCSDDARLATSGRPRENALPDADAVLRMAKSAVQHFRDQCEVWDVPPAPATIAQAVTSAVPALLLSGAYDPATPPHWARFAASRLSRSWQVVFPHLGHGVLESEECAAKLMRAFLSDPLNEPTADCLSLMGPPEFVERQKDGG